MNLLDRATPIMRVATQRCQDNRDLRHLHQAGRVNVLARNRTWSSTFAESCARPSHPEDNDWEQDQEQDRSRAPHPGIEPGLAASKAAVRPPHPRGSEEAECPCQESNLVLD